MMVLKEPRRSYRIVIILFIIAINVGCDQLSKNLIRKSVEYNERIALVSNYFTLTKVENSGAFLGLGSGLPPTLKRAIFSIMPAVVISLALYFLILKIEFNYLAISGFCFMVGGGIGNVFDRFMYNSVTDFLYIDLGLVSTGIFNLADVSIMMGLFLVVAHQVRSINKIKTSNLQTNE